MVSDVDEDYMHGVDAVRKSMLQRRVQTDQPDDEGNRGSSLRSISDRGSVTEDESRVVRRLGTLRRDFM